MHAGGCIHAAAGGMHPGANIGQLIWGCVQGRASMLQQEGEYRGGGKNC